jgi:hypothetical protein
MKVSRRMAVAGVAVLIGGCGLMDALDKLKGLTFMLPTQTFTVSTDDANWHGPPAGGIPALPCGPGQPIADCCMAPPGAPAIDCTRTPLSCEAEHCALRFKYEKANEVNLNRDVPSLKANSGMIFSDVLLKQIDLDVKNDLNVTTPPIDLYVAPANVTSSSGAQKFATIPMQAPGYAGHVVIPLDDNAQRIFSNFARATQTPFNIIMSTSILVKSGEPVPMGSVEFKVSGLVEAKL